ncbi:hypothetical protein [Vibrio splendidus]|uniref:hypothetical protein n=1 Tax=Vibrio splendidus TaxID=29497 RepID=UPI00352CE780
MLLVSRKAVEWQLEFNSNKTPRKVFGIILSGLAYFLIMMLITWGYTTVSGTKFTHKQAAQTQKQKVLTLERGLQHAEYCKLGPLALDQGSACKSSKNTLRDHYKSLLRGVNNEESPKAEESSKTEKNPKLKRFDKFFGETDLNDRQVSLLIHLYKVEILNVKSNTAIKTKSYIEDLLTGLPLGMLNAMDKNINLLWMIYVYLGISWIVHCGIVSGDFKPKWLKSDDAPTEEALLSRAQKEDREYNAKLKKIEDQFDEEVWKAESKRSQALLEAKEEKDQAS